MWDLYYDEVEYKENTGERDISGNIVYLEPIKIKCRLVSGGMNLSIEKDGTSINYTKEYQIPIEGLKEGDMINGREIVNIEESKDVFGRFHFSIARVL